jgi:probable rRNA maturation factor
VSAARLVAIEIQDASGCEALPAEESIRTWATHALGGDARGELTIRIVSETESADLNSRYRRKPGSTNVLAFPSEAPSAAFADGDLPPLGDLAICARVVAREAGEQGKPLDAHWAHIVIHGVLHLLGYDHETDSQALAMEARERDLLAAFGVADPYENRGQTDVIGA